MYAHWCVQTISGTYDLRFIHSEVHRLWCRLHENCSLKFVAPEVHMVCSPWCTYSLKCMYSGIVQPEVHKMWDVFVLGAYIVICLKLCDWKMALLFHQMHFFHALIYNEIFTRSACFCQMLGDHWSVHIYALDSDFGFFMV